MTPERWQQIETLCRQALQRKPDERNAFLNEVCGDDQSLRQQIASLLAHENSAEGFIERPALEMAGGTFASRETAFSEGQTFGHYRIIKFLGSGGMGQVYKARDTRLDRSVAIKILLDSISERPEFRERFRHEAQALAKVRHPNICVIHDVGQQDGLDYIVMEHLEGETLAHRLARGGLPTGAAIQSAIEIADALNSAHREGVVHRDLKPSNIMLTRSGTKLMDFGLAKLAPDGDIKLSTIRDADVTMGGRILGTLSYMSPEQVEGKEADARSDVFAVGVILYELQTGEKAFGGTSPAGVIAAILNREPPPVPNLDTRKSRGLDYVTRKCIAKNPDDRFQSAHDLLLQLRWIAQEDVASKSQRAPSAKPVNALLLVGLVALLFAGFLVVARWNAGPAPPLPLTRFPIYPPGGSRDILSPGTLSPDGREVAFVSLNENGNRVIWLRSLDSVEAKPLSGTEGTLPPFFWSPDSKQIGFITSTNLKKVTVPEGPVQTLADVRPFASGASGGGSWSSNGTIVFVPGGRGPLFRISADGGVPSPVTALNEAQQEYAHVWPFFLPDGKHFLYVARARNAEKTGVYVGLLGSMDRKRILDGETFPAYSPPGYVLFTRVSQGQRLLAQVFDTARLELSGDPILLASNLEAIGAYSVSQNGLLTFWAAGEPDQSQLIWYSRSGEQLESVGSLGAFYNAVLSPSGGQIAVERVLARTPVDAARQNIWLSEGGGGMVRLTAEGPYDGSPIWSPDGKFLAFTAESDYVAGSLGWTIRRKRTDGQGQSEELSTLGRESYTTDWSPDGQFIAYDSFDPETGWDCWVLPMSGERKPQPVLKTPYDERQLQFSPDGQWIAYTSNLSGRSEVYVQRFPISGSPRPISLKGGVQPRWSRDGRELFYLGLDQNLMAVPLKKSPVFTAGAPVALFAARVKISQILVGSARNLYDVSADGRRFLINTLAERSPAPITVMLNWTAALKR